MSGLSGLTALAGIFDKLLGLFRTSKEQSTGAALQRGKDSEDELERMQNAARAGNDPALDDPDGVRGDPANRNRQG